LRGGASWMPSGRGATDRNSTTTSPPDRASLLLTGPACCPALSAWLAACCGRTALGLRLYLHPPPSTPASICTGLHLHPPPSALASICTRLYMHLRTRRTRAVQTQNPKTKHLVLDQRMFLWASYVVGQDMNVVICSRIWLADINEGRSAE
jgi:hypothetical protein